MSYSYLASPYSSPDPTVMAHRYVEVCKAMNHLIEKGIVAYSPILHFHYFASFWQKRADAEFWKFHNLPMLEGASNLTILVIFGWRESSGIKDEMRWAREMKKPIYELSQRGLLTRME